MYYYLPSCKVKILFPDISHKIQTYLKNKGVTILGCCKHIDIKLYEDDVVINNCTSCAIIINEKYPFLKQISLYEYLLLQNDYKWPIYSDTKYVIQDCFKARNNASMKNAVRLCLQKMEIEIIELSNGIDFDGTFKYKQIPSDALKAAPKFYSKYQKHIEILNDEEIAIRMSEYINKLPLKNVVVYCNSCYKGLKMADDSCKHILELLFQ